MHGKAKEQNITKLLKNNFGIFLGKLIFSSIRVWPTKCAQSIEVSTLEKCLGYLHSRRGVKQSLNRLKKHSICYFFQMILTALCTLQVSFLLDYGEQRSGTIALNYAIQRPKCSNKNQDNIGIMTKLSYAGIEKDMNLKENYSFCFISCFVYKISNLAAPDFNILFRPCYLTKYFFNN